MGGVCCGWASRTVNSKGPMWVRGKQGGEACVGSPSHHLFPEPWPHSLVHMLVWGPLLWGKTCLCGSLVSRRLHSTFPTSVTSSYGAHGTEAGASL